MRPLLYGFTAGLVTFLLLETAIALLSEPEPIFAGAVPELYVCAKDRDGKLVTVTFPRATAGYDDEHGTGPCVSVYSDGIERADADCDGIPDEQETAP